MERSPTDPRPPDPADPATALERAERERTEVAWTAARAAASADPAALQRVADAAFAAGDLAASADALEAARAAAPVRLPAADALLLTRIGALRVRTGEFGAALRALYDALELSGDGYTALQLGNALRYQGERSEAEGHLERAFTVAKRDRDGTLAVAALTAQGELSLDAEGGRAAVELFGRALGLTELGSDPRLAIAPLAGLAHAHAHWRAPAKGAPLAEEALARADRAADEVGAARALWAQGVAQAAAAGDPAAGDAALTRGSERAAAAPHRPLWLRIAAERIRPPRRAPAEADPATLERAAQAMGMTPLVPWLSGAGSGR